jgi:ribonuclease HII
MPRRGGTGGEPTRPAQPTLALGYDESVVCGVDEAGRGPLAGPVYAAAVVLDPFRPIDGLRDSKQLDAAAREGLAVAIRERALCWAVAVSTVEEIDRLNILQATLLAMRRAVDGLAITPTLARVDGNQPPSLRCGIEMIIGGDASHACISAASILAKTERDAHMCRLHERFPQYRFDRHKGYGTREHFELLIRHGACIEHRRSFAPVREVLAGGTSGLGGIGGPGGPGDHVALPL